MTEQPFTISVPDEAIDDLHRRLRHTRWPDTVTDSGWTYGLDLDWMRSIAHFRSKHPNAVPLVITHGWPRSFLELHLAKEAPMAPQAWAERAYNVVRWTEKPKGGHFAAWEEPEVFAADVREFVAPFREQALREGV